LCIAARVIEDTTASPRPIQNQPSKAVIAAYRCCVQILDRFRLELEGTGLSLFTLKVDLNEFDPI